MPNDRTVAAKYHLMNDGCKMNMANAINRLKQTPLGDREIVFDTACAMRKQGHNLDALLTCLKATFAGEKQQQGKGTSSTSRTQQAAMFNTH